MPEGPEVRRHADTLHAALTGEPIVTLTARTRVARAWLAERPEAFPGRRVERVFAHGKNLIGLVEGDLYFYSHLLMWGRWLVETEDLDPPRTAASAPASPSPAPPPCCCPRPSSRSATETPTPALRISRASAPTSCPPTAPPPSTAPSSSAACTCPRTPAAPSAPFFWTRPSSRASAITFALRYYSPANSTPGASQVALIRLHSPCQVHPLIAQIWRSRLPQFIVIAANDGYLPGRVNFSARSRSGVNVLEFLRAADIGEGEGTFGHGHDQASGGSLPVARWNALLAQWGFAS